MSTPPQDNPPGDNPAATEQPVRTTSPLQSALAQARLRLAAVLANRRLKWIILASLMVGSVVFGALFVQYLTRPEPLPDMLKVARNVSYAPHYMYSIYGVDGPVGIAVSPDGKRLYATETNGNRLVKILSADTGKMLGTFGPPLTNVGERAPIYVSVDAAGRVFVTDRLQHAVFIYDAEGNYLDTMLGPTTALSAYIASVFTDKPKGAIYYYNNFEQGAHYRASAGSEWITVPVPVQNAWSPMGINIAPNGKVLVTDVRKGQNQVLVYPFIPAGTGNSIAFPSAPQSFGASGTGDGQFLFPQDAMVDSQDRYYVIDGNNSRIMMWSSSMQFQYFFGTGTGTGALNLPRGAFIDPNDRLFVVDAVGQNVKVYNVAGNQPVFMYSFGDIGIGDGQFNYPIDVALYGTGTIYIADRDNNRIQVWSY